MLTNLELERRKQARWRVRPKFGNLAWHDRLLVNEFLPAPEQAARQAEVLERVVRFAVRHVPYYRDLFERLGFAPEDVRHPADLTRLPPLTRRDVQQNVQALRSPVLPQGHGRSMPADTSGTTGQPVTVWHSEFSAIMFRRLKQRELRWADVDPLALAALIYPRKDLPRQPDGSFTQGDMTCRMSAWPVVGSYFFTGPFVGLDSSNPVDRQRAWLEEHRPNYLLAMSAILEQLALAFQNRPRLDSLRSVTAAAQQLTPGMRRTIQSLLGVPVRHNYGLNEIGIVASECPEAGRFHVHAEHCLVEIVDERGQPCPPGNVGRLLVTGLSNLAMPLLRYDADDLAQALEEPCPCGRTLPSFGPIQGRYRRTAFLPQGVWNHWLACQRTLHDMPAELMRSLRQFQLYHYRDGRFVLRLAVDGPLPAEFLARIHDAWTGADQEIAFPLEVVQLSEIPNPSAGKFQSFTSEVVPPPDWEPLPANTPN